MSPDENSIVMVLVSKDWDRTEPDLQFLLGTAEPEDPNPPPENPILLAGILQDSGNMPGLVLRRAVKFRGEHKPPVAGWDTFIPWQYVVACFSDCEWEAAEDVDAKQFGFQRP